MNYIHTTPGTPTSPPVRRPLSDADYTVLERMHPEGPAEYERRRDLGIPHAYAFDQAYAWARNTADEEARAVDHGTGATSREVPHGR